MGPRDRMEGMKWLHRSLLCLLCFSVVAQESLTWPQATMTSKPWTRWWWLGSAVDEASITQQLQQFSQAGMGGVEICPIYGVTGFDAREKEFLSKDWMKLLDHTGKETKRLQMGLDLTTGTGWPFGGPWVKREDSLMSIAWKDAKSASMQNAEIRERLMLVKRAAPGGAGNVVDPFSVAVLDRYLQPFDAAWKSAPPQGIRAQFHDSFEYFGANWTRTMQEDFLRLRGYDLLEHLPALAGHGEADYVARIKHDYRMTLNELHLTFMRRWNAWSKDKGYVTRNQGHGAPCNLIDLYAASDIPETEAFGGLPDEHMPMLQMASSSAHVKGSTLSSAESFTWLGEHFQTAHADLKAAADYLWLCGVNHIIFHGIPFSPSDAPWPGWQFYASVNMGPNGGLWHSMPAFNAYITRVQSVLQSGRADGDALVYFPMADLFQSEEGNLMAFTMHNVEQYFAKHAFYQAALALRQQGVQYDFLSDAFVEKAVVKDGKILLGGNEWQCLYLAGARVIPVATMEKLLVLARDGATICFEKELPQTVEGFHQHAEREQRLHKMLDLLEFIDQGVTKVALLGKGKIVVSADRAALVQAAAIRPEQFLHAGLQGIRRKDQGGHWYFLVNRGKTAVDAYLPLRGKNFLLMNPMAEHEIGRPQMKQVGDETQVRIELAAGESMIVREIPLDQKAADWVYHEKAGEPIAWAQEWRVEFGQGGPKLPATFSLTELRPWTEQVGEDYRNFSGSARYTTTIKLGETAAAAYMLDLGEVADSADVRVNGKSVARLWARPFTVVLKDVFRAGENVIEIEVTNVAANRIAYMDRTQQKWKIFKEINIVNRDYKPLDASTWPVRPAGLIGPVSLTPLKAK